MGQALPVTKMDIDTFLAWESEQPERHELIDGEIYAMTGARDVHNQVAGNVYIALRQALRGTPCRTFMSDMKLHIGPARTGSDVGSDAICYPDVFVTCDPRDHSPEADLIKRHPSLVVEVISPSTGAYDRGRKFELYRSLPSLQEVLFIEPDRPQADLFRRNADGRWELFPPTDGDSLQLASVGLTITLAQIYEDVLPGAKSDGS